MPQLEEALMERWQKFSRKPRGIESRNYGEDIISVPNGEITRTDRLEITIINKKWQQVLWPEPWNAMVEIEQEVIPSNLV